MFQKRIVERDYKDRNYEERGVLMKIKLAVCDDNKIDRDYVIKLLNEYADENGVILEIQPFISAEQFLFQYAEEKDYRIIVLDIEMEKMSGVELATVMNKAIANLKVAEKVIFVQDNGEMLKVLAKNIYYVEVFSHFCSIHTTEGVIETKMSISDLEKKLVDGFIRVHRSYLVNLEQIKRIAKTEILMENGELVPLARRKYKDVNIAFIRYFGERAGVE